jgi:hypothetical protein
MNLLEATALLVDCAKEFGPGDSHTRKAIKRMEQRLRVLKLRAAKARRKRRHKAWEALQHFAPECRCGHVFTFGEFVRAATIDHRGWIQRFDCPACQILIIKLRHHGGRCYDYAVDCISLHSGEAVGKK